MMVDAVLFMRTCLEYLLTTQCTKYAQEITNQLNFFLANEDDIKCEMEYVITSGSNKVCIFTSTYLNITQPIYGTIFSICIDVKIYIYVCVKSTDWNPMNSAYMKWIRKDDQ